MLGGRGTGGEGKRWGGEMGRGEWFGWGVRGGWGVGGWGVMGRGGRRDKRGGCGVRKVRRREAIGE